MAPINIAKNCVGFSMIRPTEKDHLTIPIMKDGKQVGEEVKRVSHPVMRLHKQKTSKPLEDLVGPTTSESRRFLKAKVGSILLHHNERTVGGIHSNRQYQAAARLVRERVAASLRKTGYLATIAK